MVNPSEPNEMWLIHEENDQAKTKTKVEVKVSESEKLSQKVTCNECEKEVELKVKAMKSIKFRYFFILLPSLILGGYLIFYRFINEGADSLILSLVLYVLFGFLGYLILMNKLFNSFLSLVTTSSSTHSIQP